MKFLALASIASLNLLVHAASVPGGESLEKRFLGVWHKIEKGDTCAALAGNDQSKLDWMKRNMCVPDFQNAPWFYLL
jgi:hypothetical protein